MSNSLFTTIISASAIIVGSLIGAAFSWIINNRATMRNIQEQYRLQQINRDYEENYKCKELCINANIVRLDICTAIFQSIRHLQNQGENNYLYVIPISRDYQKAVASLTDKYSLRELSYIYQLYGIIEKVNRDIFHWNPLDPKGQEVVRLGVETILIKVYGDNYKKVLQWKIDDISYEYIYQNNYMKEGYKEVISKLDQLCDLEKEKINTSCNDLSY